MRRFRNRDQAPLGLVRLGFLLWLVVLAGGGYLGVKYVPPYWQYLSMLEPVKDAAIEAGTPGGKEERIRADLIGKARQLGLELTDENVEIFRTANNVVIRVAWEYPVDLPRYRHTLRFTVESQSLAP